VNAQRYGSHRKEPIDPLGVGIPRRDDDSCGDAPARQPAIRSGRSDPDEAIAHIDSVLANNPS
jgi:hypothetical protein